MQKRILVVVHHSGVSSAVSELLRREGYLVEETEDDQKALSKIRREEYAAIVSDIASDGLRVLENAKGNSFIVPVILMSNEHILTRNEAIQLGADELIEKSDSVFEQLNKIKSVLDGVHRLEPVRAFG
jgi:DNA-binding response OmpR family regulator